MRYNVEDIEDQLIATLKQAAGLEGVTVDTQVSDIDPRVFQIPEYMEGFVRLLPFVLIRYQGRTAEERDAMAQYYTHSVKFRLYVGAQSLRVKKEGQRSAYAMLRSVYDAVHGYWPLGSTVVSTLPRLAGESIKVAGFSAQSPMLEAGGQDEMLIVNLPSIVVYQTDYRIRLMA